MGARGDIHSPLRAPARALAFAPPPNPCPWGGGGSPSGSCCPPGLRSSRHAGCPLYQTLGQAWIGGSSALCLRDSLIKGMGVCPARCSGTSLGPVPGLPELSAPFKPPTCALSPCSSVCFSLPNWGLMKDRAAPEHLCPKCPWAPGPQEGGPPAEHPKSSWNPEALPAAGGRVQLPLSIRETEVPLGRPLLPAWWAKFLIRSQWVVVLRPHSNLCRLPSGCPFPWSWGPAAATLSSPHSNHVVSGAPEWFRQGDGGRESAAPHSRAHSFLGGCSFLETHAGASTGVILGSP